MKKSELKMMIREIVREEVALTVKDVIKEIIGGKSKQQIKPKPKPEKQYFSKNKVLNDVLNETATSDRSEEWETMGGSAYTTDKMNNILGNSYGNMMNDTSNPNGNLAAEMGVNPNDAPDFLTKDYRAVMKAIDKKQGK